MHTDGRERRTHDVLRLLRDHQPIGSVRLTEHLRERGYSVTERTVRLTLAELDEKGLTEKVGGKGRRLTDDGRAELQRGGVWGRSDHVNERLAELTSHVDYDPTTDGGRVVVGTVTVPDAGRETLEDVLRSIDDSPIGPVVAELERVTTTGDGQGGSTSGVRVALPSSVTINGVLLNAGIDADLEALGIVEYSADPDPDAVPYDDPDPATGGGAILRYTDAIGNERATFDVASVLVGAGRTDVETAVGGDAGLLLADYLEFPLSRGDRAAELAAETRARLGGVIDLRRPREPGPSPWGTSSWSFGTLTQVGLAECVIGHCVESGIAVDYETLDGVRPRAALGTVAELEFRS